MKKFFVAGMFASLCLLFWACQKEITWSDADILNSLPDTTAGAVNGGYGFSFKHSDTAYAGCIDAAEYTVAGTAKFLNIQASDPAGQSFVIGLTSPTGSLSTGSYSSAAGTATIGLLLDGGTYAVQGTGTSFTFQITTINDTLIEGTFSANLTDPGTGRSFYITNGHVKALIGKTNPCTPPTTTGGTGNPAVAVFGLAATSCTNAVVAGTYTVGVSLTSANTVSMKVDVVQIGTYTITTSTENGIYFTASGSFSATGSQTLLLHGAGTPGAAGTTGVPIVAGSSSCSFNITVGNPPTTNAAFTLAGAPNTCSTPDIQGNYVVDSPLNATHKVTLNVNVTTAGTYNVTTTTVDGMTFKGSGVFQTSGPQKMVLVGSGKPTAGGAQIIPITAGSTNCSFTITVGTGANPAPCTVTNNTAHFSTSGDVPFYAVSGIGSGGSYTITANGNGGDLRLEFFGINQPASGEYIIQPLGGAWSDGVVRVSAVNSSINFNAAEGKVYVTVANGKAIATFCSVTMTGSLGGPSFSTVVSAKVTEQ